MTAFVDAFAFIAFLNPRDSAHVTVRKCFFEFDQPLVTTEWVLLELADALAAPHLRGTVASFIDDLRKIEQIEIVGFERELYDAGFEIYANRPDKYWSLTDCISFHVMATRGLTDAWTADRHFEQAGFRIFFPTDR